MFARLIPNCRQGRIVPWDGRSAGSGRVVARTHTLEGHSKGVLSVSANDQQLLSGSKDRLAKLWDLCTGSEVRTLGLHPNNVNAVRFVPNSHLAISTSMYQIRVWDLRMEGCAYLLQSSGQTNEGDSGFTVTSRQNVCPMLETVVHATEIDPTGRLLFSSYNSDVRIWSLEKMVSYGRALAATHSPKSEVSCLATASGANGKTWLYTGSKDHYVKAYEIGNDGKGTVEATIEFSPPHYDNVTCILPYNDHLYTASKDSNIMKIRLTDAKRDHLELKAHNAYVLGLCTLASSSLLTSVCKEGNMRFWDVNSTHRMRLVDEVPKAHSEAINEVSTNSTLLFTASSDQTIGFWKPTISG